MAKPKREPTAKQQKAREQAFAKPATGQFTPGAATNAPKGSNQSASQPITNQGATAYTQQNGQIHMQQPNVPQAPIVAPPSAGFAEKVAKAAHMDNVVPSMEFGKTAGTVQTQAPPNTAAAPLNMTAAPAPGTPVPGRPGFEYGQNGTEIEVGSASIITGDDLATVFGGGGNRFGMVVPASMFEKTVAGSWLKAQVAKDLEAEIAQELPTVGAKAAGGFTVKAANLIKSMLGSKIMDKTVAWKGGELMVTEVVNVNKLAAWALKAFIGLSTIQLGNVAFGMFQKNEASDTANLARSDAKFGAIQLAIQADDYEQYIAANEVAKHVVDTEIELWNPLAGIKGNALNAMAKKRALEISQQVMTDQKIAFEKGLTKEQQENAIWEDRRAQAEAVKKKYNEEFLATTAARLKMEEESARRKNEDFLKSTEERLRLEEESADRKNTAFRNKTPIQPSPAQQREIDRKTAEDLKTLDTYWQDYDEIRRRIAEETRPSKLR